MIRVIGIDPGSYSTGFGIIDIKKDGNFTYLTSGCIRSRSGCFLERLRNIYSLIHYVFMNYKPMEVAIEKVFFFKNNNATLKLSQVSGVIMLAAVNNLLSVFEYNISIIRKIVFSKANLNKKYVNQLICEIFKLNINDCNISDALAVAVAHVKVKNL